MTTLDKILELNREAETFFSRSKELIKAADYLRKARNQGSIGVEIAVTWDRCNATRTHHKFAESAIKQVGNRLNLGYELAFQAELGLRKVAREYKLRAAVLKQRAEMMVNSGERSYD